jgi:hypothetical protein
MNTVVLPAAGPLLGLTASIAGVGAVKYVNWSAAVLVLEPAVVVTVTCTVVFVVPEGAVTKISLSPRRYPLAGVVPKVTVGLGGGEPPFPANPEPKMVTVVPPADAPRFGLTALTIGALAAT